MLWDRCLSVCLSVGACVLSVCNVGVLWPNGWIDQDETWHGGRPRPSATLCQMGTQLPLPQRGTAPDFRPCLLWPNGRMHQDGTWYGGRPWPRPHCVRRGSSSPPQKNRVHSPQFSAHVYCGQTPNGWMDQDATWYGDRPRPRRHCVRWWTKLPLKWGTVPHFLAHVYCGQTVAHVSHC